MLEAGVEPATNSLGNCCSIQLSYPSDSFPCFLFRPKQERRKISTFTHRCAPAPIAARKRRQRPHKYSERRAQRQGGKRSFRAVPRPSRILYYPNTGKGERSERGGKRSFRPATRPDVPLLPIKTTFYLWKPKKTNDFSCSTPTH